MSVNDESKTGDGQRPPMPIMSVVAKLHGSGVEVAAPGATVRKFDLLQYGVAICDGPAESRLIVLSRRSLKNFFQSASSGWMTWLHRLGAMALWIVFFAPLVSSAGPIGVALEHYIGPGAGVWEYPTLGMIAIVLLVVSSLLGLRRGGLAALYVVSFPFVAATLLILAAVGAINFIRLGYRLLGSFMMTGANSLLIFIGCLSIDRAQRPDVIAVLGLALFLAASYVVLSNFHWVTTPFQSIVDFAAWVKDWAIGEVTKASSKAVALRDSADIKNRDKQKQEIVKCAETIAMHGRYAAAFSERAGALRGGRVLLFYLFAARFLLGLLSVVLSFAGLYRALYRLDAASFSGTGIKSFWYGFYYSTVTFFTVGDGSVSPVSTMAQTMVVLQISFALLTLTVLALSFSTLSVDTARENTAEIERIGVQHRELCVNIMQASLGAQATEPSDCLAEIKANYSRCMARARKLNSKNTKTPGHSAASDSAASDSAASDSAASDSAASNSAASNSTASNSTASNSTASNSTASNSTASNSTPGTDNSTPDNSRITNSATAHSQPPEDAA